MSLNTDTQTTQEIDAPKLKYPKPDLTDISLFEPQTGYVVLQQWTEEETTAGGIIIPDAQDRRLSVGWVLKIGAVDPAQGACLAAKEGDTVLFCDYAPTSLEALGKNILTIKASDVLGIFRGDNKDNPNAP